MTDFPAGLRGVALVLALLAVSACAETEFLIHSAKRVSGAIDEPSAPTYKIGDPYRIQGLWYYPAEDYEYDETGIASWYGAQFHGRRTANGEVYDMNALTAAHRTLPLPSFVRVTNLENGRSLILRVNDRGPFARGRIIDVSRRGAQLLGFHDDGTSKVRVQIMADQSRAIAARLKNTTQLAEVGTPITVARLPKPVVTSETLAPPPGAAQAPSPAGASAADRIADQNAEPAPERGRPSPAAAAEETPETVTQQAVRPTGLFVQAGAFSEFENANRVRARLTSVGRVKITSVLVSGRDLFRVRVGPLADVPDADRTLERVIGAGYPNARIVVD